MTNLDAKLTGISKELCETYTHKISEALFKGKTEKKRFQELGEQPTEPVVQETPSTTSEPTKTVSVEFDWDSFRDLFLSLVNEGAEEVIDTILESLVSKDCAVSLLSTLLEHCKQPVQTEGLSKSKHELIRGFLQQGLTKYVIKYSEDPNEWGYYKNGVLCDVVEIDVGENEEINWIFRDVTQNIEHCTEMQQFVVNNYYIPEFQQRIKNIFFYDVKLSVDWASIDYAAQDYAKAVYTIYHEHSAFVLGQILESFEFITTYEEEELVNALAMGVNWINISLQPGQDSTRKDFDIDDKAKSLTLRLCLEADEFTGVFRRKDLVPIIKVAGLYNTDVTKMFKMDLLSAAACTYKVPRGDLSIIKDVLGRANLGWSQPSVRDSEAIEGCRKFIEQYYKKKIQKWNLQEQAAQESDNPTTNDVQQQMHVQQQLQQLNGGSDEEELLQSIEDFEQIIKAWHIVKFNKRAMQQERYFVLTNKAYWTFKYDFATGKNKTGGVDEKHFKRHDLCDFCVADIGNLEVTSDFAVQALKVFTYEKRKRDMFGNEWKEVRAGEKKGKISGELRKSVMLNKKLEDDFEMLQRLTEHLNTKRVGGDLTRIKQKKPERDRPNTNGCYSSLILPFGQLPPQEITEILTEIAWCLYAAAVSRQKQRGQTHEPFMNQILTKPKKSIIAKGYNLFEAGFSKKKNKEKGKEGTGEAQAEKSPVPEIAVVKKHQPMVSGKVVKGILKAPKVYTEPSSDSPTEAKESRHITFKPQVHVFYTGDDEEGEANSDQFFAIEQNVEE